MLNSLGVLLQGLPAAPAQRAHTATRGPAADPVIYERNLEFIQDHVLPPGWRMNAVQELVGPENLEDVAAAARDAGRPIGVHLYLFRHYGDAWGWEPDSAAQLQEVVDSLDRQQLPVRGIMAHVTGYPEEEKDGLVSRFLSAACQVAHELAPADGQPVAVHWADSTEALRTLGPDGRMQVPGEAAAAACRAPAGASRSGHGATGSIEFWARLGKLGFAADPAVNREQLRGGVRPVMRWQATVASLGWEDVAGRRRLVATVDLSASPGRYPAPSWWAGADAYAASSLNDLAQPSAFVCIHGQQLRLAAVPRGDGGLLRVDVTDAAVPVRPGDSVCLLGDERGLKDLADEMGADYYNVALCLRGSPPMEGSDWWPPSCVLPF
ncbi:hypothetical protein ABPG77_007129 [Micractinium sp. CCAP 211/92]